MSRKDIILSGVGGQGILTIATVIGYTALENGMYLKQAEVHGMSQRGGDVQSHLRISDKEIFSDLIPHGEADIILSVEPMEALRYLPYLSDKGWMITNSKPYENIPNYPELDNVLAEIKNLTNHIIIDADAIAKEIGSPRSMNIVMLGAAAPWLDLDIETMKKGIKTIFARKGEKIVENNIKAFRAGLEFSKNKQ
jgi:indolepyruvate ferredoxin oxidoreductase beta subunit